MLDYFLTVDKQILSMALMVLLGYVAYKKGFIGEQGVEDMSQLLLKFVTPMVVISSFQREFSFDALSQWGLMLVVTIGSYALLILIATLAYKNKKDEHWSENRISIVFGNNGFMAIPLLQALVGDWGVFLVSVNIVILNIMFWTYGMKILKSDSKMRFKQAFINPGSIGVFIGFLLFVSPLELPKPLSDTVNSLAALNTPIAMIVLGGFLAQTDLKQLFKNVEFYKLSAIRLVLVAVISFGILYFIPLPKEMMAVAAICSVTPSATAVPMLSSITNKDYKYASGAVVITTIISAFTIPLLMTLAKMFLGF